MNHINSDVSAFLGVYKNKKVLVTGHTGFKGSWLTSWLLKLGAKVAGYSLYVPSRPSNYDACGLKGRIYDVKGDVRDIGKLARVFASFKPEIVFHLAAQPIVLKSYDDPKLTFDTNIGGTVNFLECIKKSNSVRCGVIITSDKCYNNKEWVRGYQEDDELGGADPYSASKGCAELVFRSYYKSFFENSDKRIATVRAGNVIGGGDWAVYRIVPDFVRAWHKNKPLVIRSPRSTRPWQHVLEPLSGYLWLGAMLHNSDRLSGESFNFGPDKNVNKSVDELVKIFCGIVGYDKIKIGIMGQLKKESALLKLSCNKAVKLLKWRPTLNFEDTVRFTADWYKNFYDFKKDIFQYTTEQIENYRSKAVDKHQEWAK